MKSTLLCLNCKKESTTFDVFTSIPVSLPESLQLHLYVIVYRLPRKIKALLEDSRFQNAERGENQVDSVNKSYTYLTNDQPIQICLKVDKNILIRDLVK
jgi:ubiquitin C-terminal hydrolase